MLLDDLGFNDFLDSDDLSVAWETTNSLLTGGYGGTALYANNTYGECLCAPSRSTFMSGRFLPFISQGGFDWGSPLSSSEISVAQKLRHVGYMTYAVGKWHVGASRKEHTPSGRGFHRYLGNYGNGDHYKYCNYNAKGIKNDAIQWQLRYFDLHYEETERFSSSGNPTLQNPHHRFPIEYVGRYAMTVYAEAARTFIVDHNASDSHSHKPFFLYYAPYSFHYPMEAPQKYHARCSAKGFSNRNDERFASCAMVMAVDDAIGNLMDALVTLSRKTVLIITSDNAGSAWKGYVAMNNAIPGGSGRILRGNKGEPWEGGVRNHALVWSNHAEFRDAPRTYNKGFMHLVDWHATLAQLGHATKHDQKLNSSIRITLGLSIWDHIRSNRPSPREWIYNMWRGESFRHGRYKLYRNVSTGVDGDGLLFGYHWPVRSEPSHDYLERQRALSDSKTTLGWALFDLESDVEERDNLLDPMHGNASQSIFESVNRTWTNVRKMGFYTSGSDEALQVTPERRQQAAINIPDFSSADRCSAAWLTDFHTETGLKKDGPGTWGSPPAGEAYLPVGF